MYNSIRVADFFWYKNSFVWASAMRIYPNKIFLGKQNHKTPAKIRSWEFITNSDWWCVTQSKSCSKDSIILMRCPKYLLYILIRLTIWGIAKSHHLNFFGKIFCANKLWIASSSKMVVMMLLLGGKKSAERKCRVFLQSSIHFFMHSSDLLKIKI